jgi:membrane protease YdiL (CAAX protease family)
MHPWHAESTVMRWNPRASRLLDLARSGKRPPTIWRPILLYLLLWVAELLLAAVVGFAVVLAVWFAQILRGQFDASDLAQASLALLDGEWVGYLGLPSFLLMWGLTWLFVRRWEQRPFHTIGLRPKDSRPRRWLKNWLRGAGLGATMMGITVICLALLGLVQIERGVRLGQIGWLVPSLVFFLVQGSAEEVVHRGYLLPVLSARAGPWAGILASSAMFALLHSLNPGLNGLGLLNLFLSGAFLALLTLREGDLWAAFGWHSAWNWVQGPILGLEVSGDRSWIAHSLTDITTIGPSAAWLTGGVFGPEGGAVVTAVLLLGIALLLVWHHHRSRLEAAG